MSELNAHMALATFLKVGAGQLPPLGFVWHTKNEQADETERKRGGLLGVRAGVWDWLYIGANMTRIDGMGAYVFAGVAIELKSTKAYRSANHGLSPEQVLWRTHYIKQGWYTAIYPEERWEQAAQLLVRWVGGDVNDFRF